MTMVKSLFPKDKYSLAFGFMACMILVVGFAYVDYHGRMKSVAETKAAGLASVRLNGGIFGGAYSKIARDSYDSYNGPPRARAVSLVAPDVNESPDYNGDRKIVRKGSLSIVAADADVASQNLQKLARDLGGYVVSAERSNTDILAVNLSLRIPSARLDEAWAAIRKAAVKVETETMDASDVTKQFVDMQATLRNYQAEEAQYLLIMKQAKTVKDTLDVSEHLSEVRGTIEKTQGEKKYLQHDIEMSQINVQIRPRADEKVMGIEWRPLYQTKVAFRDSMQSLVNYMDTMVAFILYLPVLVLWVATVLVVTIFSFRILRFVWRRTVKRADVVPAQA